MIMQGASAETGHEICSTFASTPARAKADIRADLITFATGNLALFKHYFRRTNALKMRTA